MAKGLIFREEGVKEWIRCRRERINELTNPEDQLKIMHQASGVLDFIFFCCNENSHWASELVDSFGAECSAIIMDNFCEGDE